MEFNRILVLCTGNICRSPMAESVLRQALAVTGMRGVTVSSAGLAAVVGHPAEPEARQLMSERRIDISDHRATQLVPDMLLKANLVLVMEKVQQKAVEEIQPVAKGRVYRLGEWTGVDIPDPYRCDLTVYKDVLAKIDQGVVNWMERIR